MEANGLRQKETARSVGVGTSTLSQYLSESYTGDVARIDDLVDAYLARHVEGSGVVRLAHVETRAVMRVGDVCRMCHAERGLGVVYGESGVGKTYALRHFTEATAGVVMLEAADDWSPRVLFAEMSAALGLPPSRRDTLHDLFVACERRLKGSGRLLIVDEAEHLPYRALELLRRLHDKASVALVLGGMPRLVANLRGRRSEYAQLFTRVRVAARIEGLTEADTKALVHATLPGTNGLWRHFHGAAVLDDQARARLLDTLVGQATRIARENGRPLSEVGPEAVAAAQSLLLS